MSKYLASDIIREVRIAIDQNMSSAPMAMLADVDTLSLEDIISSHVPTAARLVEQDAPIHMIGAGEPFAASIGWEGSVGVGSGRILLPDDFLRLVTFKMSDWSYAVNTAIEETDALYVQQGSRYGGIRGNPQRPVVAVLHEAKGLMLQFWSCSAGADVKVTRARYIPIPKVGSDGMIAISDKLRAAVVYKAAYLTALSTTNADLATAMNTMCNELMQLK